MVLTSVILVLTSVILNEEHNESALSSCSFRGALPRAREARARKATLAAHYHRINASQLSQSSAQHGKHVVGRRNGRSRHFRLWRLVRRDVILHVCARFEVLKGFLGDGMREAEEHWQRIEKRKLTWSSTRPLKTRMSITPLSDRDVSVKKTGSSAAAARMREAVLQLQGCRRRTSHMSVLFKMCPQILHCRRTSGVLKGERQSGCEENGSKERTIRRRGSMMVEGGRRHRLIKDEARN